MQEHAGLELATTIFHIEHNVACAGKVMLLVWIAYGSGMDLVWIEQPYRYSWACFQDLPGITEHTSCPICGTLLGARCSTSD